MKIEVLPDAAAVARRGAAFIAASARQAVRERGRLVLAVSGGRTPGLMLGALSDEDLQWDRVEVCQVDERVAPPGDPERNLTHLEQHLLSEGLLPAAQLHAMDVEATNLEEAARRYALALESLAGSPPVLDLIHLGLGADGHTASLVPGDPVLGVTTAEVAVTLPYQGRRRMTLTYPILNRARRILWLVTGGDKAEVLARLLDRDPALPATHVRSDRALILADQDASVRLEAVR